MTTKGRMQERVTGLKGLAVILTASVIAAMVLFLLFSDSPRTTIYYFFAGPFLNRFSFGNFLNASIPLMFAGLGISIAFKASLFNIGGEGQLYCGAVTAVYVCLLIPGAPGGIGIILAAFAGAAAGALIAGFSGYLKMKWDTDLLITSFLISGAVVLIINYLITGPLDDPESSLLATRTIDERFWLPFLLRPSKLDISIIIALFLAGLVHWFYQYTHRGYELRMFGANPEFARYGGVNVRMYVVLPMVLSGALHGLGGAAVSLGTHHMALKEFTAGMGWNGIAVALIARNNPLGVIPAALFFAYLNAGANAAMLYSDVTIEIAAIIQSIIFYLITAQALYDFVRRRSKAPV